MSREIYTYTDIRNLEGCPCWQELKKLPQITVSVDMRNVLRRQKVRAVEFGRIKKAILPAWLGDETRFRCLVILSDFLRGKMEAAKSQAQRNYLLGCRRNLGQLLHCIWNLEEHGVEVADLDTADRNLALLAEAWEYLNRRTPLLRRFRRRMQELQRQGAWKRLLGELFPDTATDTLVFHGFYEFSPFQERLIRLLEEAGFRLIFVFCYNKNYPFAHEIFGKTYSAKEGFPLAWNWKMQETAAPAPVGELFEGRPARLTNTLSIRTYETTTEFVREIKKVHDGGYFIYAPNPTEANRILQDFYPEVYGERRLAAYPVGQFLDALHRLWDERRKTVILKEEQLIACFSSGWLSIEGRPSNRYMEELHGLLPFFGDCRTKGEWEERMALYRQLVQTTAPLTATATPSRYAGVMGNPLLNFSPYAIPTSTAEAVLALIEKILALAAELFEGRDEVSVQEHAAKLAVLLKEEQPSEGLLEEEREIAGKLLEKLALPSDLECTCHPSSLCDAMRLWLNGSLQDSELENTTYLRQMATALNYVDAAALRVDPGAQRQKGRIHLCYCDAGHLPTERRRSLWPLTATAMAAIYEKTRNPQLRAELRWQQNGDCVSRYLVYTALKNDDVQLSWIRQMGEKVASPSPYLILLEKLAGIYGAPVKRRYISTSSVAQVAPAQARIAPYELAKMPADVAKEARMDYALCPMKYVLGWVLERTPSFRGEFQLNYAINGLISALAGLMKETDVHTVYREVMQLFPYLGRGERRQIYDYLEYLASIQDEVYTDTTELGGFSYTQQRLKVRFPNKEIRERALFAYGRLYTPNGRDGLNLEERTVWPAMMAEGKYPKEPCSFCPQQEHCRWALFVNDEEQYYE